MIFFVTLALMIGCIVISVAAEKYYNNTDRYGSYNETDEQKAAREKRKSNILFKIAETDCLITIIPAVIFSFAAAIMLVCIIITHCGTAARAASLIEQQKALEYKVATDYAKDEFGLHNKELIDDVQKWNEDIAYSKIAEKDLWIGIFYPNIINKYDIHTIELKY